MSWTQISSTHCLAHRGVLHDRLARAIKERLSINDTRVWVCVKDTLTCPTSLQEDVWGCVCVCGLGQHGRKDPTDFLAAHTVRDSVFVCMSFRNLTWLTRLSISSSHLQGYPNIVATYGRGYTGFAPSYSYQFPGKSHPVTRCVGLRPPTRVG